MNDLIFFIVLTFFLSAVLFISRYRWFYRGGKLKFNSIIVIEIISFVTLELFLIYVIFFRKS